MKDNERTVTSNFVAEVSERRWLGSGRLRVMVRYARDAIGSAIAEALVNLGFPEGISDRLSNGQADDIERIAAGFVVDGQTAGRGGRDVRMSKVARVRDRC